MSATPNWWPATLSVARFELAVQRREPATVLYALVFLLLTFGFVSSGVVELVRDRDALPKLSPLAIALALGGLTAFGQVITTMIVASAFLRDDAWRTDALVFSTPLPFGAWSTGRWAAASVVMIIVYTGLPAGVLLGAAAPWVERDVSWLVVFGRALRPFVTITLPTMLTIATLLAVAAVHTRRLLGVLATALALLFLWQACDALRDHATWSTAAALLDPFATTPVQVVTALWSDAERASHAVPVSGLVGANRLLWAAIAFVVAMIGIPPWRRSRPATNAMHYGATTRTAVVGARVQPRGQGTRRGPADHAAQAVEAATEKPTASTYDSSPARSGAARALARFTLAWTLRERGWQIIAGLGALNVAAHAWSARANEAGTSAAALVALVQTQGRLFCILLATIYAGELVWRDRDQRIDGLVDSLPISITALVLGRMAGVVVAQLGVALLLVSGAWLAVGGGPSLTETLARGMVWIALPFVQWTALSLTVHTLVQHKIMAHLALIAGWVGAVALNATGFDRPWYRFADPPPMMSATGEVTPLLDAALRGTGWSAVSLGFVALAIVWWRGTPRTLRRATSPR